MIGRILRVRRPIINQCLQVGLCRNSLSTIRNYDKFRQNKFVLAECKPFAHVLYYRTCSVLRDVEPIKRETDLDLVKMPPSGDLSNKIDSLSAEERKSQTEKKIIVKREEPIQVTTSDNPQKPSLWQRFKNELIHYYHGFRLLGLDVKIASGLCVHLLMGKTLTRRERNQLVRTMADIFRLIPFAVFIIVPFMEFLLPFYLKLFPSMLPSTFKDPKSEESTLKQQLKAKLQMASFLQETLAKTSSPVLVNPNAPTMEEFSNFLRSVRDSGAMPNIDDIVKFSQLFEDQVTLDSLEHKHLKALCQLLDITSIGPSNLLRFQLWMRVRQLKAQDQLIDNEGVNQIPPFELQSLCRERGMRSLGLSEDRLRAQLSQWLVLHLEKKVPISLLLLSRTMYMQDSTLPEAKQLQLAISNLPEKVSEAAKMRAVEAAPEGTVDTKTKIELLRKEQETIKAERKAKKVEEKMQQEEIKDKAPEIKQPAAEFLTDKTDVAKPLAQESPASDGFTTSAIPGPGFPNLKPEDMLHLSDDAVNVDDLKRKLQATLSEEKTIISAEDMGTITKAIAELEETNKAMQENDLAELKEDLAEASKKQIQLGTAALTQLPSQTKVSKNVKKLANRVDKMLNEMNSIMGNLVEEKNVLMKDIEIHQVMAKHEDQLDTKTEIEKSIALNRERVIEVNDLMLALRRIQKVPDDTKWQRILEVMDEDRDGKIELPHVLSVIELLGADNMKLNEKEMRRILDMLDNEKMVEVINKEDNAPVETSSRKLSETGDETNGKR